MTELYFEFRTTVCSRRMEILTLSSGGAGGIVELNLRLAADSRLELSGEAVAGGERLCAGRWHAVVVDRSHLGRADGSKLFSFNFHENCFPILPNLMTQEK